MERQILINMGGELFANQYELAVTLARTEQQVRMLSEQLKKAEEEIGKLKTPPTEDPMDYLNRTEGR